MTDRADMEGLEYLEGVKITERIKYLGVVLYCDRPKLIRSIKT